MNPTLTLYHNRKAKELDNVSVLLMHKTRFFFHNENMVKISCYFERQEEDLTTVKFYQVSKSNETQRIIIFIEEIRHSLARYAVWLLAFFATFLISRWTCTARS